MSRILTKDKTVTKPIDEPGEEQVVNNGLPGITVSNTMAAAIKILIIENDPNDIEFIQYELKKGGINYIVTIVQNEEDYKSALANFIPDIILSDFALPKFDGNTAFEIRNRLVPDTPFIFISGTIGEERSVDYIKNGLTDYVLKDRLYTLAVKVNRALEEVAERNQKRKAEDELIRSEMRFRALIEKSTNMKTLSNLEGKFLYASPSVTKILGYALGDFLHKTPVDLIHPDDLPGFLKKREGVIHSPGTSAFYEVRLRHKNGNWIWCEGITTNMLHEPAINALVSNFNDITERKLAEAEREKMLSDLVKQNAELEQFAYVASHDLQEPLRMITSFLTQLERKYGEVIDDKGKQYIHFAVDGAKRMRQIILDLLDFSRVGRTDDDLEMVDFNKLINEILALYRRQVEELNARINFEELPTIQIYKTPIRQVFQNLISNSLKYHAADRAPVIKISFTETNANFQFSVNDNGIGIASEYFDKIFIIFQRLHNKDEYSGTGMGLAIAKKIVESFGGKIWVESEEG
ncbi:MAG TPA: ATP-binding protein, partial [Mucilaginibacter sp.]|nr:ATP-binding protein [Mucilaginibacter sp.]